MMKKQIVKRNTQLKTEARLLSASAVGEMLSLSKRQIFRLNSSGKIPKPVRIGGSVRWQVSDIEQWIEWNCPGTKTVAKN